MKILSSREAREAGVTGVEYAIMIAAIAGAVSGGAFFLGNTTGESYSNVNNQVPQKETSGDEEPPREYPPLPGPSDGGSSGGGGGTSSGGSSTSKLKNPFIPLYGLLTDKVAKIGTQIDSNAPNGPYTTGVFNKYLGNSLDDTPSSTWAFKKEGATVIGYVSSVSIDDCEPGDWIKVIRYNPNRGTYTAGYANVYWYTADTGDSYNVIRPGAGSNSWREYSEVKQDDTSKSTYDSTYDVFMKMPDKLSV